MEKVKSYFRAETKPVYWDISIPSEFQVHGFLRGLQSNSQSGLLAFADFQNVSTCYQTIWACFCAFRISVCSFAFSQYLKFHRIISWLPFMKMVYWNGEILSPYGNKNVVSILQFQQNSRFLALWESLVKLVVWNYLVADFHNASAGFNTILGIFVSLIA